MKPKSDELIKINNIEFRWGEIYRVVDKFYSKVQVNPHLRGPFGTVENWPEHIDRLTHFWWIRFGGSPYLKITYNPIQKHFESGFSEELLEVWKNLFKQTLIENLNKAQIDLWMDFVNGIGNALNYNNELMKEQHRLRKKNV